MSDRPKRLWWIGEVGPDGRPVAYVQGMPTRDLDESDVALLSDEQIETGLVNKLYRATSPHHKHAEPPAAPETAPAASAAPRLAPDKKE